MQANLTADATAVCLWHGGNSYVVIKGSATRDFLLQVFYESVSTGPLSIPLGPCWILSKTREYKLKLKISCQAPFKYPTMSKLACRKGWIRICKLLRRPAIDSEESISARRGINSWLLKRFTNTGSGSVKKLFKDDVTVYLFFLCSSVKLSAVSDIAELRKYIDLWSFSHTSHTYSAHGPGTEGRHQQWEGQHPLWLSSLSHITYHATTFTFDTGEMIWEWKFHHFPL
jgi:hypothetical protein